MKILLDENFPLQLYHRLRKAEVAVEHIIVLGLRGLPDGVIRQRLITEEDLVLLTQDTEFEDLPPGCRGKVIISRVRQSLSTQWRADLWFRALQAFLERRPAEQLFDLLESGEIVPWTFL